MKNKSYSDFLKNKVMSLMLALPLFAVQFATAQMHHQPMCNARFWSVPDTVPFNVYFVPAMMGSGCTYAWSFGDGATDTVATPSHLYSAAGVYNVCLTLTRFNSNGDTTCSQTWCDSVYVMMTPPPPPVPCSAHFSDHQQSGSLDVEFEGSMNLPGTTYSWDFGDGTTGSGMDITHTYAAAGSYNVCLTVTLTDSTGAVLCTDTDCDSVTVSAPQPAPVNCSAHFRYFTMRGDTSVRFFGGFATDVITYAWDFGDGSTDTIKNPKHTYAAPGTYNVCLTISSYDTLGNLLCTDTWCDSVNTTVHQHMVGWQHQHGHDNGHGNGHTHLVVNTSGMNEISTENESIRIGSVSAKAMLYPNPVSEGSVLSFAGFAGDIVTVRLFDSTGRMLVVQNNPASATFPIGSLGLKSGVYFYQLTDGISSVEGKVIVP